MDIQESLRRILEQKKAVTQLFFAVALSGRHEGCFVGQEEWGVLLAIYAQFTNDLLQTLREFHGADWNPELMAQWRTAIECVGRTIFAGHQERFLV
jgi:hypothetical protein